MALTERWAVSRTDVLTGLLNRRAFHGHLKLEMGRSHRYEFPMACVMIDLDYFKRVNDTFGTTPAIEPEDRGRAIEISLSCHRLHLPLRRRRICVLLHIPTRQAPRRGRTHAGRRSPVPRFCLANMPCS